LLQGKKTVATVSGLSNFLLVELLFSYNYGFAFPVYFCDCGFEKGEDEFSRVRFKQNQ